MNFFFFFNRLFVLLRTYSNGPLFNLVVGRMQIKIRFEKNPDWKNNANLTGSATLSVTATNMCCRKTDPKEATLSLQKAVDIYTEMGRFTLAAKQPQVLVAHTPCP